MCERITLLPPIPSNRHCGPSPFRVAAVHVAVPTVRRDNIIFGARRVHILLWPNHLVNRNFMPFVAHFFDNVVRRHRMYCFPSSYTHRPVRRFLFLEFSTPFLYIRRWWISAAQRAKKSRTRLSSRLTSVKRKRHTCMYCSVITDRKKVVPDEPDTSQSSPFRYHVVLRFSSHFIRDRNEINRYFIGDIVLIFCSTWEAQSGRWSQRYCRSTWCGN